MTLAGRMSWPSRPCRRAAPGPDAHRVRGLAPHADDLTVDPLSGGRARVRIHTRWFAHGFAGLVEALVAPTLLGRVYREQLRLLDRDACASC